MQQPRPQPSVFATMFQEQSKQPRPWVQQELFAHLPIPRECKCRDCEQLRSFRLSKYQATPSFEWPRNDRSMRCG